MLQLLANHPYLALSLAGLLERIGIPLLLSPFLVAAGALAASGQVHFDLAMWVTLLSCMIGDAIWYEAGRRKGDSVLSFLCRISLERDSCVRHSKGLFGKGITRTLVLSKWLPGVSHIVPAVAGLVRIDRKRFLAVNTLGSFLWIVVFLALGYVPVRQAHAADVVPAIAPAALEMLLVFAAGNVIFKYAARRRFMRDLYKARITPEDLRQMMDEGRPVTIIDLRHALDSVTDPRVIPGAIRMLPDELTSRAATLPREQDIVLYCT
jgi:membrane protein DedA with SNARE-associated domain